MKNFRFSVLFIVAAAASAAFTSCCRSARIEGTLSDAPGSEVVVKLLDINNYKILDTVDTDKDGGYYYKTEIAKGQPEFIYLFYKDTKIASLLLDRGDNVKVTSDTLGSYSVDGSEESNKLQEVEKDYSDFMDKFAATLSMLSGLDPSSDEAKSVQKDLSKQYIDYYRSRIRYILQNSHSMTCIPVLYQSINENFPIFSQQTDAIHFNNIADSLSAIYPESEYVKALKKEAERRGKLLNMGIRLRDAEQLSYPDLILPDINGKKVRLSEIKAKVVMIQFWSASDASEKMYNLDVIKPLYEKYHEMGLEIYQVGIDLDKGVWASVVKNQKLPWINVCDGLGNQSPAVTLYNLSKLPVTYFLKGDNLTGGKTETEKSLERTLAGLF
jgi:hypothetical protein